jgi:RimJ/RimL family protein N-acetyltransferase
VVSRRLSRPEISWVLIPGQHVKGYATEAARCALQAAYAQFGWQTAVSVIATSNAASHAVAQRLKAKRERTIPLRGA